MSYTVEELQRMLEWAEKNDDQEAIGAITQRLNNAQTKGAIPDDYVPGQTTAEINAGSDPIPPPQRALAAPSSDTEIDRALEERGGLPQQGPALQPRSNEYYYGIATGSTSPKDQWTREYALAQEKFDTDQELLRDPANRPSRQEYNEWFATNTDWKYGASQHDAARRQVIKDPVTGKLRWTAPDPHIVASQEKADDYVKGALAGVAGTIVDTAGNIAGRMDDEQYIHRGMQEVIWESLSNSDRIMFRESMARRWTEAGDAHLRKPSEVSDNMIMSLPPQQFKEILDELPNSEAVLERIAGDEQDVAWGERWRRLGNKILRLRDPYGGAVVKAQNPFGAEQVLGDVTGVGAYEGLDEKYERTGQQAPAYPGASSHLEMWLKTAEAEGATTTQVYREIIAKPFERIAQEHPDTQGKLFGDLIHLGADKVRENAMTEALYADYQEKGFLPKDFSGWDDIWNKDTWINDTTALPWNDFGLFSIKAAEQVPYYFYGRYPSSFMAKQGVRWTTLGARNMRLEHLEKLRNQAARKYGALGGGLGEAAIIYDQVHSETKEMLRQIPIETLKKDPTFMAYLAQGMTEESARQLLIHESSSQAGRTGFLWSGALLGAPAGYFLYGPAAAGRLLPKSTAVRRTGAALGEPLQEAAQETMEFKATADQIARVDPENPILAPRGYFEAAVGGATLGISSGVISALSTGDPDQPVGYEKEDIEVARKVENFTQLRNKRFALQNAVTDPAFIAAQDSFTRLAEMEKLENLQQQEADAILDMAPTLRSYLEQNPTSTSAEELKMLNSLEMFANATLTDIAVARQNRRTAQQQIEDEAAVLAERVDLQKRVNESIVKLEDIDRLASGIEAVQNNELIDGDLATELAKEGYIRVAEDGELVVKQKGRRALKELMRQKRGLEGRIESGYAGAERRRPEMARQRYAVDQMGPQELEQALYTDNLTGAKNQRAFERDVLSRYGKPPWAEDEDGEGPPPPPTSRAVEKQPAEAGQEPVPAVAAVDLDTLAWVNDNWGHDAGDRVLMAVADAISEQEGVTLYRTGGDEFAVTGESEAQIEKAMQAAKAKLDSTQIREGRAAVTPQITWATGATMKEADIKATRMKAERRDAGKIAGRKEAPVTLKDTGQMGLFMLDREGGITRRDFIRSVLSAAVTANVPVAGSTIQKEAFVELAAIMAEKFPKDRYGNRYYTIEDILRAKKGDSVMLINERAVKRAKRLAQQAKLDTESMTEFAQRVDEATYGRLAELWQQARFEQMQRTEAQAEADRAAEGRAAEAQARQELRELERQESQMPNNWKSIKGIVKRGDSVEILTPGGAIRGTITRVNKKRWDRPRLHINVLGREYIFNPEKNWLIFHPTTNPADIAFITGDPSYVEPGRDSFPQVIQEVQIGHIGRDGGWYADIGIDERFGKKKVVQPSVPKKQWQTQQDFKYSSPRLSRQREQQANTIIEEIKRSFIKTPTNIYPVTDLEQFARRNPKVLEQMIEEGGHGILYSAQGYFDHLSDDGAIYIFLPNLDRAKKENFEMAVAETVLHELMGHYGVRGLFGDEAILRPYMHELVDTFHEYARYKARRLGMPSPEVLTRRANAGDERAAMQKQVLGEEMVAYLAGQVLSNKIELNEKQKGFWQRFLSWIRDWLSRHGFNKYAPIKKFTTPTEGSAFLHETREIFWTDRRIQELIFRASDFIHQGKNYEFRHLHGRAPVGLNMRDADIFRAGILNAIDRAFVTLTKNERKQLANKYDGIQNVPKEMPLFTETFSLNKLKDILAKAQDPGKWGGSAWLTQKEAELIGMGKKTKNDYAQERYGKDYDKLYHEGQRNNVREENKRLGNETLDQTSQRMYSKNYDELIDKEKQEEIDEVSFNIFEDLTYADIMDVHKAAISENDPLWFENYMPPALAAEMRAMLDKQKSFALVGPIQGGADYNADGQTIQRYTNPVAVKLMDARREEILAMKVDPKKATLTADWLRGYVEQSKHVYRLIPVRAHAAHNDISYGGDASYIAMSYDQAGDKLFGEGNWNKDEISVFGKDMIEQERKLAQTRGWDIGFNEQTKRWLDYPNHDDRHRGYTPEGALMDNADHRVTLIVQQGRGVPYSGSYDDHWSPNIMHIRTGVAKALAEVRGEEVELPQAPNPARQGQFLALIELQSDFFQRIRKMWNTRIEKQRGEQRREAIRRTFKAMIGNVGKGVAADLYRNWETEMMSLADIQINRREELINWVRENHGVPFDEQTDSEKKFYVFKFRQEIFDNDFGRRLREASDVIEKAMDEMQQFEEKINGSNDWRANPVTGPYLNQHGAKQMLYRLRDDLNNAYEYARTAVRDNSTRDELVAAVTRRKSSMFRNMNGLANDLRYNEALMRIPFSPRTSYKELKPVYDALGANTDQMAQLFSSIKSRETATLRLSKQTIDDLIDVMYANGDMNAQQVVQNMFDDGALTKAGIDQSRVSVFVMPATEHHVDVEFIGSDKQALADIEAHVKDIVEDYMWQYARPARQNNIARIATRAARNADDISWTDIRDFVDWETHDTDESSPDLDRYSLYSYEEFLENENESSEVDEAISEWEMNVDWSAIGEEYTESGEEYQNRIITDEDGDQDVSEAEEWLIDHRQEYIDDTVRPDMEDQVSEMLRERWYSMGGTELETGQLPISWDENGDPTEWVEIALAKNHDSERTYVYIDDDSKDYYWSLSDAQYSLAQHIKDYYEDQEITPPAGELFGPTNYEQMNARQQAAVDAQNAAPPNYKVVAGNIVETAAMMSGKPMDSRKAFKEYVALWKKQSASVGVLNPMSADKDWRPVALDFLLADAVRRGFPGIVWHNGLASSKRGGMGMGGTTNLKSLTWERQTIPTEEGDQEVFTISSPQLRSPMMVGKDMLIQVLGSNVVGQMVKQIDGTAPLLVGGKTETNEDVDPRSHFLISRNQQGVIAVTRRHDGSFVAFASSDEEVDQIIAREATPVQERDEEAVTENLRGEITEGDVGSIFVISGHSVNEYAHTWNAGHSRNRLGGSRYSYEGMTYNIWNKKLAKFGVQIEDSYIQVNDFYEAVTQQGQEPVSSGARERAVEEAHGNITIEELTGDTHGWMVMSSKSGPVISDVFQSRSMAQNALDEYIGANFPDDRNGIRVYYIPINDAIREEYSGPVAPFMLSADQENEHVQRMAKKVGMQPVSLRERVQKFRYDLKNSWQWGMYDDLHGIYAALKRAEASDVGYMQARLSRGIDAMMYEALYRGHPVWRHGDVNGVMGTEGKGLIEIFAPLASQDNANKWGLYRAARRGKRLMMEGVAKLPENMQRTLNNAAAAVYPDLSKEDAIWQLLIRVSEGKGFSRFGVDNTTGDMRWALNDTERLFASTFLPHMRTTGTGRNRDVVIELDEEGFLTDEKTFITTERTDPRSPMFDPFGDEYARVAGAEQARAKKFYAIHDLMDTFKDADGIEFRLTNEVRTDRDPEARTRKQGAHYFDIDATAELYPELDFSSPDRLHRTVKDNWAQLMREGRLEPRTRDGGAPRALYGYTSAAQAEASLKKIISTALAERAKADQKQQASINAQVVLQEVIKLGREHRFTAVQMEESIKMGDQYPIFKQVDIEYERYNKAVLDFAEKAGVIDPDSRAVWEHADYVPFFRVEDERVKGPLGYLDGISNIPATIRTLRGGKSNVNDIIHNIMINTMRLIDAAHKNRAALTIIDELKETGIVSPKPLPYKQEIIDLSQLKKHFRKHGFAQEDIDAIPEAALKGFAKMWALGEPSGPGIINVMRNGKREYWQTSDMLLYKSMTMVNRAQWHKAMQLLTGPKRFFTATITLTPGFGIANFERDAVAVAILSPDKVVPILSGIKGFWGALSDDEVMQLLRSSGAAFENGWINAGDPKSSQRLLQRAMRQTGMAKYDPVRLVWRNTLNAWEAYKAIMTAAENANRLAVFNASRAAGKSELRSAFDAKNIMDFSLRGGWGAIQWLCLTVPFFGARQAGQHRLAEGLVRNPKSFLLRTSLLMLASLALYWKFKDDERYKDTPPEERDLNYKFWIGEKEFTIPKPFEIGALFSTLPERLVDTWYRKETDDGKLLMDRIGFMLSEMFALNPIPQAAMPIAEGLINYDFFRQGAIVPEYMQKRLPPEQYRSSTSPTMIELARVMPKGLETWTGGKINSPLHLQHFYEGYTGTIGRFALQMADILTRQAMDYPLPPAMPPHRMPVIGRFYKGEGRHRRLAYEDEFYNMLERTAQIAGSLKFLKQTGQMDRYIATHEDEIALIRVAPALESIREAVRDLNYAKMLVEISREKTPEQKDEEIQKLQEGINKLIKEGWKFRPGGEFNLPEPVSKIPEEADIHWMIDNYGMDNSQAFQRRIVEDYPATADLLDMVASDLTEAQLDRLAGLSTAAPNPLVEE